MLNMFTFSKPLFFCLQVALGTLLSASEDARKAALELDLGSRYQQFFNLIIFDLFVSEIISILSSSTS